LGESVRGVDWECVVSVLVEVVVFVLLFVFMFMAVCIHADCCL
jgi:hypothetical protein